jgi:hypothetical protein
MANLLIKCLDDLDAQPPLRTGLHALLAKHWPDHIQVDGASWIVATRMLSDEARDRLVAELGEVRLVVLSLGPDAAWHRIDRPVSDALIEIINE